MGTTMAKGQQRSNKEIKKPKKVKESAAPAGGLTKGMSASAASPKKK